MPIVRKQIGVGESYHYSNEENKNQVFLWGQSNAGIDEHGNHFHAVDNPLTGKTTVTLWNPETGETTVRVRPRRNWLD